MTGTAYGQGPPERVDGGDWVRGSHHRDELAAALVAGGIAGPVTSHDRADVAWRIARLADGDHDLQLGLRELGVLSRQDVLAAVAAEAGFDPDPRIDSGPTPIDPFRVLAAWEVAGDRLALAAAAGERALLATGHPAGLTLLYQAFGELMEQEGAKLLRPLSGHSWREAGRQRQIRYLHGVAVLSDRGSTVHTHAPGPMELLLREVRPDLVVADHGFAGAAIQAGVETISVADVNDPALVVAKRRGRTEIVVVMDDNVLPEDYWPCFQAVAARFP